MAEDELESWAEEELEPLGAPQWPLAMRRGGMQIKVRVPEGCCAGDTLEVVAPSGDLIHVVIPAGHGPGALLCLDDLNSRLTR